VAKPALKVETAPVAPVPKRSRKERLAAKAAKEAKKAARRAERRAESRARQQNNNRAAMKAAVARADRTAERAKEAPAKIAGSTRVERKRTDAEHETRKAPAQGQNMLKSPLFFGLIAIVLAVGWLLWMRGN
jgi:cobalamin biosynthesis Mg chelatase CobN